MRNHTLATKASINKPFRWREILRMGHLLLWRLRLSPRPIFAPHWPQVFMGSFSCVFMCLFKFFSWNLLRQTGQILSNSDTLRDCWGLPTCTGACPWSPSPPRGCPWSPPPPRCCPWSPSLSRICPWSPSPPIGWLEAEVCGAGETLPRGGLLGLGVGGALFPLSKREEVDMLARCGCGEAAGESAVWSDSVEEECIRLALLTTGDFSMPICSSLSPRLSATKKNSSKVC